MLYRAIQLAKQAHNGQVRKYTGEPYFLHPLRVMDTVAILDCATEKLLCVAVNHDVLEDTDITYEELVYELDSDIAEIVKELTNVEDKSESRSMRKRKNVQRLGEASKEAKIIKLADRLDNLPSTLLYDPKFAPRYIEETEDLLLAIEDGDASLAERIRKEIADYRQQW